VTYPELLDDLRRRTGSGERGPLALISLTISGAQEFLACARSTRDVWNGSYLLSYLMWSGTQRVLEDLTGAPDRESTNQFALIPALSGQPLWVRWAKRSNAEAGIAQFPNSVLLAATMGEKDAQDLAAKGIEAIGSAWRDVVDSCRRPLNGLLRGTYAEWQWNYQLEPWRVFESYSSVLALPECEDDEWRDQLEAIGLGDTENPYSALLEWSGRRLRARKARRDFEQVGEEGLRCGLCGQRSALADYDERPNSFLRGHRSAAQPSVRQRHRYWFRAGRLADFWERVTQHEPVRWRFRKGERLCAVCTVRRLAPEMHFRRKLRIVGDAVDFPSTSSIATAHWVKQVVESGKEVALDVADRFSEELRKWLSQANVQDPPEAILPYHASLGGGLRDFARCDGRWFYPETYQPEILLREYGIDPALNPAPTPALIAQIVKSVGESPDDYIALVVADGDRMGNIMTGQDDWQRLAPDRFHPTWQMELSRSLAKFAAGARSYIEGTMPGKVVYAGGEDLLAFVPRRETLRAIQAVHDLYMQMVGTDAPEGKRPTISIACVFVKHNEPLSLAIEEARHLLKEVAKKQYGRNAFATFRTTSAVTAGMKFLPASGGSAMGYLRVLEEEMAGRALSPRLIYDLQSLSDGLTDWGTTYDRVKVLHAAQRAIVKSRLPRHFAESKSKRSKNEVTEIAEHLFDALADWPTQVGAPAPDPYRVLIDLLHLVQFVTRHA
jgi:CRISPR-associated protein Cmr2